MMPAFSEHKGTPSGTLFCVSTPIGNLDDLSGRAIETLRSVSLIACEDTRHTRKLLTHYEIKTPLTSFFIGNEKKKTDWVLRRLAAGEDVALVTDAGTPGISDPGYSVIHGAIESGFLVQAIPGPSALLAALVTSGAPMDEFLFIGFLPHKGAKRTKRIQAMADEPRTVVLYESCHRLHKLLGELLENFGDRFIMVCRELTKKFEEVRRAPLKDHIAYFEKHEPRGEFVVVIPKVKR